MIKNPKPGDWVYIGIDGALNNYGYLLERLTRQTWRVRTLYLARELHPVVITQHLPTRDLFPYTPTEEEIAKMMLAELGR
jgi:hypothetical protein